MAQGDQVNLGPCEECCGGGEVPAPCECPAGLASSYTIPKFNFTYLAGGFWTCTVSGTIVINLTPSSECSWGKVYTDDNGHELVVVLWLEIGLIPNPPAVQVCKWVVEVSDADFVRGGVAGGHGVTAIVAGALPFPTSGPTEESVYVPTGDSPIVFSHAADSGWMDESASETSTTHLHT